MIMSKTNFFAVLENQELIQKLIDNGHGETVDCFLSNEGKIYTKKGRLNKSAACRELKKKNKDLDESFRKMRELLKDDLAFDD
jgi:hypothetical protein